jgi:hypothetical protein
MKNGNDYCLTVEINISNKMKNKKYHTVGTVLISNSPVNSPADPKQIVTEIINTPVFSL